MASKTGMMVDVVSNPKTLGITKEASASKTKTRENSGLGNAVSSFRSAGDVGEMMSTPAVRIVTAPEIEDVIMGNDDKETPSAL